MEYFHSPVLLQEVLQYLKPSRNDSLYIDCTTGEGGHSEAILNSYTTIRLICLDADEEVLLKAKYRLNPFLDRVRFFNTNFDTFFQNRIIVEPVHRILFDLGISMFHYLDSKRGFSFNSDEDLDMRINPKEGDSLKTILKTIPEDRLGEILFTFGEEPQARRVAAAIARYRKFQTIQTSKELAEIVERAIPRQFRRKRIHPATKTFQALRILVNKELVRIEPSLRSAFESLEVGGRIAVISFHSLEDRIVKTLFKELSKPCTCSPKMPICKCGGKALACLPVKKLLRATEFEISKNPASRSAKLRVIEKIRNSRQES